MWLLHSVAGDAYDTAGLYPFKLSGTDAVKNLYEGVVIINEQRNMSTTEWLAFVNKLHHAQPPINFTNPYIASPTLAVSYTFFIVSVGKWTIAICHTELHLILPANAIECWCVWRYHGRQVYCMMLYWCGHLLLIACWKTAKTLLTAAYSLAEHQILRFLVLNYRLKLAQ